MPRWGLQGVAAFLATLFALTVVTLPWLPRGKDTLAVGVSGKVTRPGLAGFGLLAMAIYFVGVNSNWAFLELIGTSIGFDREAIGYTLALSLIFGAFGSVAATLTSQRIQSTTALTIAILGMGVYVILMRSHPGALGFTAALLIFNLAWNYSLPFQMEMVAAADASGRYVALLPASQTAGGAIGPILAGPLLMTVGVDALYAILAAGSVVACLIFALVRRRL
jgi:predicted MFS family arabinose efflux permease